MPSLSLSSRVVTLPSLHEPVPSFPVLSCPGCPVLSTCTPPPGERAQHDTSTPRPAWQQPHQRTHRTRPQVAESISLPSTVPCRGNPRSSHMLASVRGTLRRKAIAHDGRRPPRQKCTTVALHLTAAAAHLGYIHTLPMYPSTGVGSVVRRRARRGAKRRVRCVL